MKFENIENFKKLTKEASGKIVGGLPSGDTTTKAPIPVSPRDTTGTGHILTNVYQIVNGVNTWVRFD